MTQQQLLLNLPPTPVTSAGILGNIKAFYRLGDPTTNKTFLDSTGRGNDLQRYQRIDNCTATFRIGRNCAPIYGASFPQQLYGAVKGWGKWNRLLTSTEKATLYGQEYWPFTTTTSLQDANAYHKLDEAGGSATYSDSTVYANHLTATGTTTSITGPTGSDTGTSLASGIYLSKTSPSTALQSSQENTTIAGWVRLASKSPAGAQQQVFWGQLNNDIPQSGFNVYYDPTADRFVVDIDAGGSNYLNQGNLIHANSFGSPAINTWYFILCEVDLFNNQITICINNGVTDSLGEKLQPTPVPAKIGLGAKFQINPTASFASRTNGWDVPPAVSGNCYIYKSGGVANADLHIGAASKTIWTWFKTTNSAATQTLAGFYTAPLATTMDWLLQISANKVFFDFGTQGNSVDYITVPMTDTNWHLVVCWYDLAANTIHIDLDNGAAVASKVLAGSPNIDTNTAFVVGAHAQSPVDGTTLAQYQGILNAFGIADGAATATDISNIWNGGNGISI